MNVLCFCSLQAGWSCVHFRRRPSLLRQHVTAISLHPRSKSDGGSFMPIPSVYFDKKSLILDEDNFSRMYIFRLFCLITKRIQNKIIQKYEKFHTKLCMTVQMLKWTRFLSWFWFCSFGISDTIQTYEKTAIGFFLFIQKPRKYRQKRESFWHW